MAGQGGAFSFNFGTQDGSGSSGEQGKQLLMGLLQQKLTSLIGSPSGLMDNLAPEVKKRVTALKALHDEYVEMELAHKREECALEAKYAKLYASIFDKRFDIITGMREPTEAELARGKEIEKMQEIQDEEQPSSEKNEEETPAGNVKGVPGFWLQVFQNHRAFEGIINDEDVPCLRSLKDIRVRLLEDNAPSFALDFHFDENEYFTNKTLSKEFKIDISQGTFQFHKEAPALEVSATEIQWKFGRKLTPEAEETIEEISSDGRIVDAPLPSFFSLFSSRDPDDEEMISHDFQIALAIKDDILPRAIAWFTGDALEMDDESDGDDEDEAALQRAFFLNGADDDSDDSSDEDYDPQQDDSQPPPECKQQ